MNMLDCTPPLAFAMMVLSACDGSSAEPLAAGPVAASVPAPGAAEVVEIRAVGHHAFALDRTEVPAGWTTFRFANASPEVHFAIVEKLPEGKTIEDYEREIAPPFQTIMNSILGRDPVEGPTALPGWYGEVVFLGGPGLTAAGLTSSATMNLAPGTYLVECYVKTADGSFHSYLGMVEQFTVTDAPSQAKEPKSNLSLTISGGAGIEVAGRPRPGMNTVAVHFADQAVYSHFLGHDVHLVRLDADMDLEALGDWMNWTNPDGLATPAPATFLGGVQDMPSGSTGYMSVHLTPGEYAWIAEVPDPAEKNMLVRFSVPATR